MSDDLYHEMWLEALRENAELRARLERLGERVERPRYEVWVPAIAQGIGVVVGFAVLMLVFLIGAWK